MEEVAKQTGVDLIYNSMKLKYMIEGTTAPLKIHNDVEVRVYVSLKKHGKNLLSERCMFLFLH